MTQATIYEGVADGCAPEYLTERILSLAKIGAAATDTTLAIDVSTSMRDLFETIAEQAEALARELEQK